MTIWAFNEPNEEAKEFVSNSIKGGFSRFGWSFLEDGDLSKLENKAWPDMTESEVTCWQKSHFLLRIQPGDWIVHINLPEWGKCTAVKVLEGYSWDQNLNTIGLEDGYTKTGDYRSRIKVDPETMLVFNRNDPNVHPNVRLKGMGRFWRIYSKDEFLQSISDLKQNRVSPVNESIGLFHLKEDLEPTFLEIVKKIQQNHKGKKLELFIADVFRKIPRVIDVIENGFGFKSDFGADLIVTFESGLPFEGLVSEKKLIVQIKSFTDNHWDTCAVEQIRTGIEQFDGDAGLLITTALKTEPLEKAIEKLGEELNKPIALLAGPDVAKFIFKYYGDTLFVF